MNGHGKSWDIWLTLGRCLVVAVTIVAAPPLLPGQESISTPQSKVERKNKAPVSREILRVKLPKPVEAKLKNGLTVLILEDHRAPFVNMQLHIGGAGALFEPADMAGLASTTAHIPRGRSQTRASSQIPGEVDTLAAPVSPGPSVAQPGAVVGASGRA